jgi:hypothetical protein
MNLLFYAIMIFLIGFLFASVIFFFIFQHIQDKLKRLQNQSILEDLELATSDELLKELRSRPKNAFIIITPINNENEQGVKIELNYFTPFDSISILHMSANMIFKELKSRGMQTPELPIAEWEESDE